MHTCVCSFFCFVFFFYQGLLSQTLTIHRTAGERRGPTFIPLYHFHSLTNIETFICNFACEMLSATKLDETFPNQKFDMSNYKALRRDRNGKGILFYINENILFKIIKDEYMRNEYIRNGIEMILFEFLVRTRKWFCVGIYKPWSQNENYFLDIFQRSSNM